MRRYSLSSLLVLLFMVLGIIPVPALAAAAPAKPEQGLLITPLRQYLSADAGTSQQNDFTIANLTKQPLTVSLSVQRFSVTDYVYDYKFSAPENDWLHLSTTSVDLKPNQSSTVPFSIIVPRGSAPGGHYYTLFASANLSSQGIKSTVQGADLIYLTVNGQLTSISHLQKSSIGWISFGRDINFNLQPVNTGNIYSFVYVSGELHGWFVKPPQTSVGHILFPGKVRSLSGSIPSPVLPGLYQAVYGYRTESNWIIQEKHWVLFIPPWFIALLVASLLFFGRFSSRPRKPAKKEVQPES